MKPRRRPPNPEHLDFLSAYEPHIVELALATRDFVLEEAPDAIECSTTPTALCPPAILLPDAPAIRSFTSRPTQVR